MAKITLRVISGVDRGKTFHELAPPITIGREDGNVVRLNDERISRYHVKVQEDDGRLVITDLDSTNGTRINGHACNLKILRYGDTISVGRSVLLVGSREQIADLFDAAEAEKLDDGSGSGSGVDEDFDLSTGLAAPKSSHLSSHEIRLPLGLSAVQSAELRELLDYIHAGMRSVLEHASSDEHENRVQIDVRAWQNLLVTQSEISQLIRAIEDPEVNERPQP
ncbi:FHA domain-containing protein [Aureliella helgolandensis]|uniref:Oxoglutarate dehydrogenase inhibitor n=1 Tax=Aureliella helgolandensis TaxID=2527968 RepID=A0A518GER8_9BACT|nr:FHA domain-containing protein [Aureliella helgolandensis]QDV27050.1 Oxoglutarate dehydrogenase inhibitor [Aureliella helgolandensis]